jgi:cell division septation protein DedD
MTEETQEVVAEPVEVNHISTVRRHLLDQMRALRGANDAEAIRREIDRSKGIAELAQAMVNTAKVEVDYLKATGQASTPFLEVPPDQPYLPDAGSKHDVTRLPSPGNGITSITQHRMKG